MQIIRHAVTQMSGILAPETRVANVTAWIKLLAGLAAVFLLFQGLGQILGSDRGQAGLVIAGAVVVALLVVELVLFARRPADALRTLGFGWPAARGLVAALVLCLVLLALIPAYAMLTGARFTTIPGWLLLLPGLFAQAGIAEEALFRGYLFGRLRQGRSFWQAASLAMLPFVLVHLILFATMPWPIALAAVLLSVVLSFPLARLYELGGRTIWAPALVHFTVQGAVKVLDMPGETTFPLVWMAASALLPYLVFLIRAPIRG